MIIAVLWWVRVLIPMVTSGVWFTGSVILLIYTFICMLLSGLMILGSQYDYQLVSTLWSKTSVRHDMEFINSLSVTFVLYILTTPIFLYHRSEFVEKYKYHKRCRLYFLHLLFFCVAFYRAVDRLSTI